MDNLTTEQDGNLETLRVSLPYQAEPLQVYQNTCQTNGAHLLLDSADIGTKQQVKSLLLIDAALQLTCNEQQVTIQALTDNGNALLPWIQKKLESCATITALGNGLVADFTLAAPSQGDVPVDEDSRLRQISNMEPLRILQQHGRSAKICSSTHQTVQRSWC